MLPDVIVACVGGGSNAIGLFHPFIGDASVKIVGVEAGGEKVAPRVGGRGGSARQGHAGAPPLSIGSFFIDGVILY